MTDTTKLPTGNQPDPVLRYPDHQGKRNDHQELVDVDLCEDCVFLAAGLNDHLTDERHEDAYDLCPEWDGWTFASKYADDDPECEGEPLHGFSWGQCDGCHSRLGGERYDHVAINNEWVTEPTPIRKVMP